MTKTSRKQIDEFFGLQRIALVGASRDEKHFTRAVMKAMKERGYQVVPVNPQVEQIDGERCFARIGEVTPAVAGAMIMTTPAAMDEVVRECQAAGIDHIWLGGEGSTVSPASAELCAKNGISLVVGCCPFMFMPKTPFFHRIHGAVKRMTGAYPS
jgi:predicted CoA-binding protein